MHEYSIVQSLLAQLAEQAERHGATAVARAVVRIGEVSGVDPDLLATAFEMLREGTASAGARLEIERVPVRWSCRACGRDIEPGGILRCPACGAPARLAAGDEIVLTRVELEVADV